MVAGVLAGLGLWIGFAGTAQADDCAGASFSIVRPKEAALFLDVRFRDQTWEARVNTFGKTDGAWRVLEGIPDHAHLIFVGPAPDGTFAVVRTSAGRDTKDRLQFFHGSTTTRSRPDLLKPWRSRALADILTAEELVNVQRSISHLRWLEGADPVSALKVNDSGLSFLLRVVGGREVSVASPNFKAR